MGALAPGLLLASLALPQSAPRRAPPQSRRIEPQTRTLLGIVKTKGNRPLEGARVFLKNIKTLEVRSYLTQANGAYRFDELSFNSDYEVFAMYGARRSQTHSLTSFDTRPEAYMNLKIDVTPVTSKPPKTEAATAPR